MDMKQTCERQIAHNNLQRVSYINEVNKNWPIVLLHIPSLRWVNLKMIRKW